MGLLSPWFLAGLAALGLPVWLHLLQQHKTTPKQFSSLMFFEKRTQSSVKHRRLKYILLMASRLLLLLLLILAFAAPFIKGSNLGAAGRKRLLIAAVDNSFSMRVGDKLARAKSGAMDVLNGRSKADLAQVMTVSATVQSLTQPTGETGELKAAVDGIRPVDSRSSFGEFARALRAVSQSNQMPVEVHFFSDMQKSSLPPAFNDLTMGQNTKLVLHSLATDKPQPNWTVETVTAPRSVFDPKKARVVATIAGFHTPAAKRNVTLLVNQKTVASKTVDVPENGRATAEFIGMEAAYGFNKAEVRVDGGDALPNDDVFFFSVERADPRPVLFVHDGRGRNLLYYRAALESASEGAYLVEPVTADQAVNLGLAKYSFIVLADPGSLAASFEDSLKKYVQGGGSVLISLGPLMAGKQKVPLLDEKIRESRYASRAGERFLVAGQVDSTHPALKAAGKWENVKFYQVINVEQGSAKVPARLSDDTPLVLEKKLGEGRVLVFTSTFDNISNDFPLRPSFIPFVEQSAGYLTGAEVRSSAYTVDSYVELRSEKGTGTVEVLNPQGKRALDLKEAATARSLALTEAGFYDVGRANGRHELVAVNPDRKESDLEPVAKESLDLWQGTGTETAGGAAASATQPEQNANLWWYVMVGAVLLALIESLLASQHLTHQKESA